MFPRCLSTPMRQALQSLFTGAPSLSSFPDLMSLRSLALGATLLLLLIQVRMRVVKRARLVWGKKGDNCTGALLAIAATVPKDIGRRAVGQAEGETAAQAG